MDKETETNMDPSKTKEAPKTGLDKAKITTIQTAILQAAIASGVVTERMRLAKTKAHKKALHKQRDEIQINLLTLEDAFWEELGLKD